MSSAIDSFRIDCRRTEATRRKREGCAGLQNEVDWHRVSVEKDSLYPPTKLEGGADGLNEIRKSGVES